MACGSTPLGLRVPTAVPLCLWVSDGCGVPPSLGFLLLQSRRQPAPAFSPLPEGEWKSPMLIWVATAILLNERMLYDGWEVLSQRPSEAVGQYFHLITLTFPKKGGCRWSHLWLLVLCGEAGQLGSQDAAVGMCPLVGGFSGGHGMPEHRAFLLLPVPGLLRVQQPPGGHPEQGVHLQVRGIVCGGQ